MSHAPPQYPLSGAAPSYDTRLAEPQAKIADPWLLDHTPFLLLHPPSRESRKRYRAAGEPADADDDAQQSHDSGDDMVITDNECPAEPTHPPKRRLTAGQANDVPRLARPRAGAAPFAAPERELVHPCTPTAMDLLTATPVSDVDEQNPQHLVLPLPLASPVQLASDKPSVHEALERCMARVPSTQGELVDLISTLGSFVLDANRNHVVFSLLQQVPRALLLSLCGTIQHALRRDLLSSLPLEVALSILGQLDHRSVLAVAQVCRLWLKLVSNTTLWCRMLRRDKLISSDAQLQRELADPAALLAEWTTPGASMNVAQALYKKRLLILRRWMDPTYEPKRISVAGHGSTIVTCLQHDEEKIITGIEGKLINVHSTKTGELLRLLKGHDGDVWALKYFLNTLVSGSTDRDVRVWNIRTGRCTHIFRGHTSTVRCLDILHPVQIGVDDNREPIIYPEVPLLVTGSRDHNLHVWKLPLDNEAEDADEIMEPKTYDTKDPNPYLVCVLLGHTQSVRSVSGYGNIIVSGSYDTTVRVWDLLDGGRCKHVFEGHNDKIYSTVLNYKTRRCFSGSMDLSINVWDFEKGKLLYSLEGHNSLVGLLELSDEYLVSAAADSTLRVWDPNTGENYSKLKGHNSAITCFQHDGLRIVSGSERMLKLWDIRTGKFVRDLVSDITGSIWQVSFDPDRCVAAVQKNRNGNEETYIEILDFSSPLNDPMGQRQLTSLSSAMEIP